MGLEQNILDAIDVIVQKRLSELSFDKTVGGIIISADYENNKYIVDYNGSNLIVYSNDTSIKYIPGDFVYISIPGNNFSEKKFITANESETKTKLKINSNVAQSTPAIGVYEKEFNLEDYKILKTGDFFENNTFFSTHGGFYNIVCSLEFSTSDEGYISLYLDSATLIFNIYDLNDNLRYSINTQNIPGANKEAFPNKLFLIYAQSIVKLDPGDKIKVGLNIIGSTALNSKNPQTTGNIYTNYLNIVEI